MLREVPTQLANTLRDEGAIDERESFIDATFAAAKGGGGAMGLTKRAKARHSSTRLIEIFVTYLRGAPLVERYAVNRTRGVRQEPNGNAVGRSGSTAGWGVFIAFQPLWVQARLDRASVVLLLHLA